jgi:hypothetical protein
VRRLWLERKVRRRSPRPSARALELAPRFKCDWTSHGRPRSHQHLRTRRNTPLTTAIGAVYVHHASRPSVRYATKVSSGLYGPAGYSKVIPSANERRVVPITNERQGTWNCGFSSHDTQQSTQCHTFDQSALVCSSHMGCPRGFADVHAMHERLPFRSPSPYTT